MEDRYHVETVDWLLDCDNGAEKEIGTIHADGSVTWNDDQVIEWIQKRWSNIDRMTAEIICKEAVAAVCGSFGDWGILDLYWIDGED